MIEKSRVISLISSAAGLLLAVGSMTVFSACWPKEDGTLMNCHNAQIRVALCGIGLSVLFAIAAFVKNKAIELICDTAAARGSALLIALLALLDILRIIKENRERGLDEEE